MRASTILLIIVLLAATAHADAPAPVKAAVENGLRYMTTVTLAWKKDYDCATCHHAPLMLWSCNEARKRGYAVDEKAVAEIRDYLCAPSDAAHLLPPVIAPPEQDGKPIGAAYVLMALASGPVGPEEAAAVKRYRARLLEKQDAQGNWGASGAWRPPIFEGSAYATRLIRLSLNEGPEWAESSAAAKASAKKVGAWLAALPEKPSQQSRTIQLMYAVKTARSAAVIAELRDTLLAMQNADGSWSQTPQMAGDAYATGQALYALGLAGKRATEPAIAHAVEFLAKTQLPEGNWPMTSRPMPPDRPGAGSTAKNLEPIATIGTGWALLGLLAVS